MVPWRLQGTGIAHWKPAGMTKHGRPNDCNFISWNTAVCGLASDNRPATWFEGSHIWDHEVCSDLAPTKRKSQWTAALPPPRECEGGDGKDEVEPPKAPMEPLLGRTFLLPPMGQVDNAHQ